MWIHFAEDTRTRERMERNETDVNIHSVRSAIVGFTLVARRAGT